MVRVAIVLIWGFCLFVSGFKCHARAESAKDSVYENLDEEAAFPGGAVMFLTKHVKNFGCGDSFAYGMVSISVIIDNHGNMIDAKILKDTAGYGLAEEALKAAKLMNSGWIPGKINGKPVKSRKILIVKFVLH